jgi:hypothetical protein
MEYSPVHRGIVWKIMGNMKHKYHEGPKAGENFEQLARAVSSGTQPSEPEKQPKKTVKRRKTTDSDKG